MVNRNLLPRDFGVETGDKHKHYRDLVDEKISPFYKQTMKDVFMYAMTIGFIKKKKEALKGRQPVIPSRVFSSEDLALVKSVAIADTKNVDVLYDENIRELVNIAEEYANGGIEILYYQVFGENIGDADRNLEQELRDFIDKHVKLDEPEPVLVEGSGNTLMEFEKDLREFLISTLQSEYGEDWWKKGVPGDVQKYCDQRKSHQEKMPWMTQAEYPLIYYADFQDYIKIILRRDNWKTIYAQYFVDQAWIKTKLVHELSPLRNSIAHNRELSNEELQKLNLVTKEILNCIKRK